MQIVQLAVIGIIAGMAISVQSSLSGLLSKRIDSPLFASASVFLVGFVMIVIFLAVSRNSLPSRGALLEVPIYLWVTGGVISALALTSIYWMMPLLLCCVLFWASSLLERLRVTSFGLGCLQHR